MVRFIPHIIALGAVLVAVAYVMVLRADNATLEAKNRALTLMLAGCEARLKNVAEDKESDNEVDNIPDDELRSVPDRWLMPKPGTGGLY